MGETEKILVCETDLVAYSCALLHGFGLELSAHQLEW